MGQAAHLRNYASLREECEIVALAELRQELGREVARRYGIPRVYRSAAELMAQEEVDAFVASQPFTRHGVTVCELAKAGKPIFTEKPLSLSISVGEEILRTLKANNTWQMVGYHKRCDPATIWAKQEIETLRQTGELGALKYVRITMPPGDWIAGGFDDNIQAAGEPDLKLDVDPAPADMDAATAAEFEAFVNYYIHQVNLMRYLLGEPYKVSYADPAQVLLVGHSESGVSCAIEMAPYATTVEWHESALVTFERGYVRLNLPAPLAHNRPGAVEVFKDPGGDGATPQTIRPDLPWRHAMKNQALAFIQAVRGEAPAPCLAEEALEDLKIARDYLRLLKEGPVR